MDSRALADPAATAAKPKRRGEADGARAPARRRKRGWRVVLWPLSVTLAVLGATAVGSFIWADLYVGSVASSIEHQRPRASGHAKAESPTSAATLSQVLAKVHGAVWELRTMDEDGRPVEGSAFAVLSSSSQTYLLTSYTLVEAATFKPAPAISLEQAGAAGQQATLRAWDPAHDLALLVINQGNQPTLAGPASPVQAGEPVYVVSGAGGAKGSIAAGNALEVLQGAIEYRAGRLKASQGSPLVDIDGSVLGMVSPRLPQGVRAGAGDASFAVPVEDACAVVLVCPGGTFPASP